MLSERDDEQRSQIVSDAQSSRSVPRKTPLSSVKRSRTGCFTCRARKVKCDELRPTCQNCQRCVLECKWPVVEDLLSSRARKRANPNSRVRRPQAPDSSNTSDIVSDGQGKVSLVSTANPVPQEGIQNGPCHGCGAPKVQCSQDRLICLRCRGPGLDSAYQQGGSSKSASSEPPTASNHPETIENDSVIHGVPKTIALRHIQTFFTKIYPCQANGFIHRGTFLQKFHSGTIDRKLLLAICAAASRFSNDTETLTHNDMQADLWAKEAKTLLILEDMTTDTVAAALLLARHEVNSGNYSSAWMLSSIATRAALALGLGKDNEAGHTSTPFSEQETRRRLFWACYCLDRMMSTGSSELVILRSEHIRLQLPCDENQYLFGIPCWTPVINLEDMPTLGHELSLSQRDLGLFGQYVQMMQMRYSILRYVRNHPEDPKELAPWNPSSTFSQCVHKMLTWKKCLAPQFQLLPDTIHVHQTQDQLSPLIMLHVWYEQCMSDLYRIVMPGFPETLPDSVLLQAPAGWVEQHQLACVRHAANIASVFETVAALADVETFVFLDSSLPMCVFDSICVRLQWLFMLPSESQEKCAGEERMSFKTLISYVERMTKYFRQAQWLLKELQHMLSRHGIDIQLASELYKNDFAAAESGSHPWQKRIQGLKNGREKCAYRNNQPTNRAGVYDMSLGTQQIVPHPYVDLTINRGATNLFNAPEDDQLLYPLDQGNSLGNALYRDSLAVPPSGWGEAEVVPSLANFTGMTGEWLAIGVVEESEQTMFSGNRGQ